MKEDFKRVSTTVHGIYRLRLPTEILAQTAQAAQTVATESTERLPEGLGQNPTAEPTPLAPETPILMGFHGYGEDSQAHLSELEKIPGAEKRVLVAVQALHPFYTRSGAVVANWMTSFDREQAIRDNLSYARRVLEAVRDEFELTLAPVAFAGFSQGVAMAYRAARAAVDRGEDVRGIIALAGDVPPEVEAIGLPPILIGRGISEKWYSPAKLEADRRRLSDAGVPFEISSFAGGHEWTDDFRSSCARFLATVLP